ncbi:MAG: NAD(P)(+) transhydrogenase (Re/Si-specific) subunit beta, partial [Acidobacteriota bacterium]
MSATVLTNLAYLIASVLFIFGLKGLTHPRTAVRGNMLGALGMLVAVVATFFVTDVLDERTIVKFELVIVGAIVGGLVG